MARSDCPKARRSSEFDLPGPIKGIYLDDPGRLYFLNPGVDHTSDKSRAQGEIYVVDRETLDLNATLEVGMAPGQLAWDAEREMFYLLTSPWATRKQAEAQLHLIGAEGIAASIDLPRRPLGAQPSLDREHFYALHVTGPAVAVIDLENLGELVSIPGTSGKVIQLMEYE